MNHRILFLAFLNSVNLCFLYLGHQFRRRCGLKKKLTGDAHRNTDYHKTSFLSNLSSGVLKKNLNENFIFLNVYFFTLKSDEGKVFVYFFR